MPAGQIGKSKISDSDADKMFDAVANGFKHAANLPIDSLSKNNAQFGGRDRAELRDLRSLAIEKNSAQQFLREFAIVCEKEQTLSLHVQTPDVEEPGKFLWKQIKHSVARMLIFSGRNKSRGFMQHDGKRWSDANKFAIDFDMITWVGLCAEVCADFAVDGNTTGRDQLIAMSARSD